MFGSLPANAQDSGSARGNLSGVVYDSSKAVVPEAEVKITGPIGSLTQSTNDQGSFLFSTLIPGFYAVRVQKAGFNSDQQDHQHRGDLRSRRSDPGSGSFRGERDGGHLLIGDRC
jgi:hypothetical protein